MTPRRSRPGAILPLLAVVVGIHVLPTAARAQAAPARPVSAAAGPVVRPAGVEARVYAPSVLEGAPGASPYFVGQLVDADSAGLTLQTAAGERVTIPRSYVQQFSVRVGAADRRRSALQGALFGAALGLLVGKISAPPATGSTGGEPGGHIVHGGIVGGVVGLAFATFNPWHRWVQGAVPTAVSGESH
jgi:hypothetical protein